jgi:hypothetical protein
MIAQFKICIYMTLSVVSMYPQTIQDMHAKVGQAIYTELAKLEVSSVEVGGTGSNDVAAPTEDDVIQICNNVVRTRIFSYCKT